MFFILTLGNRGFTALAVWPFIVSRLSRQALGPDIIRHEKIHFRQQKEMLWLPFFVWYFLEYGFRLLQYRNRRQAYLAISFEREAYDNESRAEYLNSRKPFAWLQYYSHAPQD